MSFKVNILIYNQTTDCKIYNNSTLLATISNNDRLNLICFYNKLSTSKNSATGKMTLQLPYSNIVWIKSFQLNQFATRTALNNELRKVKLAVEQVPMGYYLIGYVTSFNEFGFSGLRNLKDDIIRLYLINELHSIVLQERKGFNELQGSWTGLYKRPNFENSDLVTEFGSYPTQSWQNVQEIYSSTEGSYIYYQFLTNSKYVDKERFSTIAQISFSTSFFTILYRYYLQLINLQMDIVNTVLSTIKEVNEGTTVQTIEEFLEDKSIVVTALLVIGRLSRTVGFYTFDESAFNLRKHTSVKSNFLSNTLESMFDKFVAMYTSLKNDTEIKLII